jgi:hypothetical protein
MARHELKRYGYDKEAEKIAFNVEIHACRRVRAKDREKDCEKEK